MFEDRYTRLDLRVSKRFQLTQRVRLTGNFNFYNLLNGSAIQVRKHQRTARSGSSPR